MRSSVALDVEVFDHGFDDPVNLGQLRQVVFEVPDRDQAFASDGLKKAAGFDFTAASRPAAAMRLRAGPIGVGRNDVEQVRGNTGIGQVRGDAGSHGARAQDGDFLDPSCA